MSLLPKSIHRCRRYPTKFNSGRDIPDFTFAHMFHRCDPELHPRSRFPSVYGLCAPCAYSRDFYQNLIVMSKYIVNIPLQIWK